MRLRFGTPLRRLLLPVFLLLTLVSDLTQTARTHFAGVDNMAAGRTAGSLMGRFLAHRKGQVAMIAGSLQVRDHRERVDGFSSVLAEDFPGIALLPVIEGRDDRDLVDKQVRQILQANPSLIGLYSAGAGNQGLIRALGDSPQANAICVIAHELSDYSRAALKSGLFDVPCSIRMPGMKCVRPCGCSKPRLTGLR